MCIPKKMFAGILLAWGVILNSPEPETSRKKYLMDPINSIQIVNGV